MVCGFGAGPDCARHPNGERMLAMNVVRTTAFVVTVVACAATTVGATTPSIVGTWQRTTTCAELAAALNRKGMRRYVAEFVVGNGFVPGVTQVSQLRDSDQPCHGAVPRKHSHFFTNRRRFGSLDWRGEEVDDGTYRIPRPGTLVISKEFPKVTFGYRIIGSSVTFTPQISRGCTTFRCAWAISMAYPGKRWQRVR